MRAEVKKCADSGDIKRLRYIFADSLDVDPTFEKYKSDYEACKNIQGLFDEHQELNNLVDNKALWNQKYWVQLKLDLMKNFSEKRFTHMINVAKVVYADKVSRLIYERSKKDVSVEEKIEDVIPQHQEERVVEDISPAIPSELADNQRIIEKRKEIEEHNRRVEEEQRKQRERINARRDREALREQNEVQEHYVPKKWMGIALIIVAIIIAVLIILTLRGNNPQ